MFEWLAGLAVAIAFVAGCFVGAWQQRQVGFSVKTHIDKLVAEAMKRPAGPSKIPQPPVAQWGLGAEPPGIEHPSGPPKPMPEQIGRKDPMDWVEKIRSRSSPAA